MPRAVFDYASKTIDKDAPKKDEPKKTKASNEEISSVTRNLFESNLRMLSPKRLDSLPGGGFPA